MNALSVRIALRLLLCSGCAWLAWRFGGLVLMVCTAPLFGVALARPLVELASELRHQARAAVWKPLEGRHYTYRGLPVQVVEDERHTRWVRAADVRRIVGFTSNDRALALTYPNGWQSMGRPAQPHFSGDALIEHLRKEPGQAALHFRHWAEREIAFPARRVRARLGIRPDTAEPADIA